MVPRNSFRQFHLNELHQPKVERCRCRCLCPHATPHGAHSGSGGTPGAQNILRRFSFIHAKKHRRQIPSGKIRPSIASPLVIKQRLSRGRSLSHRLLTNSPLGNFRQIRPVLCERTYATASAGRNTRWTRMYSIGTGSREFWMHLKRFPIKGTQNGQTHTTAKSCKLNCRALQNMGTIFANRVLVLYNCRGPWQRYHLKA
jgi:hypothetical protein